jgi:hypothetical protein
MALIPTATADVCSRKPTMTLSAGRGGGSRRAESASNEEVYSVGMSSLESMARMTSLMASVATTRTMPRRAASWVAMVDLPTPVAPPINTTRGTSRLPISCHRRKFVA